MEMSDATHRPPGAGIGQRWLAKLLVLAATASALVATSASPASADCGIGGQFPETNAYNVAVIYTKTIYSHWFHGKLYLQLKKGRYNGDDVVWAKVYGPAVTGGDAVWVDISHDGGGNWEQFSLLFNGDGDPEGVWTWGACIRGGDVYRAGGRSGRSGTGQVGSWWP
jgi:hypothetical protein